MNASDYEVRVHWSEEDREWVGTCPQFPSLSWLDESESKARSGMLRLISDVLREMEGRGEVPPRPPPSPVRGGPAVSSS